MADSPRRGIEGRPFTMNNQARQWPIQMTAGLSPVQLVHNYQLGHLILMFSVKKELHHGLIEPLMSQTVWKNGMGRVKAVVLPEATWPISGLVGVKIKYDSDSKEIRVEVTLRADAEKVGEGNRAITAALIAAGFYGRTITTSPQLEYIFNEDDAKDGKTGKRSFR